MSFQNYDNFQGQPNAEQPGAPTAQSDLGQQLDNNQQAFSAGNMGGPGGPPQEGQQDGSSKTTLW